MEVMRDIPSSIHTPKGPRRPGMEMLALLGVGVVKMLGTWMNNVEGEREDQLKPLEGVGYLGLLVMGIMV